MDICIEELISEYKNPTVKSQLARKKLFHTNFNEQDKSNEYIDVLKKSLITKRVDKRCNRSKLKWLANQNISIAFQLNGSTIGSFGYQDKNGKFLYPEETLFLLESNKAEVFWNKTSLSLEQAYSIILNKDFLSLPQYKIYRNLTLQGFKLSKNNVNCDGTSAKRRKLDLKQCNGKRGEINEKFKEVFKNLQQRGPVKNDEEVLKNTLYKVRPCNKKGKELNLILLGSKFEPKIGFYQEQTLNIYSFEKTDFIMYIQCNVNCVQDLF